LSMADENQILLEQPELGKTIRRMAHEIIEKCPEPNALVLIGIRSRGVHLARRLARNIEEIDKSTPPVAAIDVSRFRDDRVDAQAGSVVGAFEIDASVDDKTIVLIDDVIYRGRTIRAAMLG